MTWNDVDWAVLKRLRAEFLSAQPGARDYWKSERDLANYDRTFGERIGWKWDAVLRELRLRNWQPPRGALVDFACGSGVAGRRVYAAWREHFTALHVADRSRLATQFAAKKARAEFPSLTVIADSLPEKIGTLVISHALNELGESAANHELLLVLIRRAEAVLWVEPGTHAVSRALIAFREKLRSEFSIVAPCTHQEICGMLAPENAPHWCHHFAEPPPHIFHERGWSEFSKTLEIDIGRIPYSFLVLQETQSGNSANHHLHDFGRASHIIGEPRHYKGFSKILSCQRDGVCDLVLQKRDAPDLWRELKKSPMPIYEWQRDGDKILGGQSFLKITKRDEKAGG